MISPLEKKELDGINASILAQHPALDSATVAGIRRQEALLVFPRLSNDLLLTIALNLLEAVKQLDAADWKPVLIDITLNGQCIFHYAMPGTSRDNAWWIERKKCTVNHFDQSSYQVGRALHLSGKTWAQKYPDMDESKHAAHGGCFPIRMTGGAMVGTIGVSGLAQQLDHVTITRVLADFLSTL